MPTFYFSLLIAVWFDSPLHSDLLEPCSLIHPETILRHTQPQAISKMRSERTLAARRKRQILNLSGHFSQYSRRDGLGVPPTTHLPFPLIILGGSTHNASLPRPALPVH